jgi:hypothetical protein
LFLAKRFIGLGDGNPNSDDGDYPEDQGDHQAEKTIRYVKGSG